MNDLVDRDEAFARAFGHWYPGFAQGVVDRASRILPHRTVLRLAGFFEDTAFDVGRAAGTLYIAVRNAVDLIRWVVLGSRQTGG